MAVRRLLLPALLPLVLRLTACSQHLCTPGETHCIGGNMLETCDSSYHYDDLHWNQSSCDPGYCITAEGRGFCSPQSTPEPECSGIPFDIHNPFPICFQNAPASCIDGYVSENTACGTETCTVAPEGQQACAFCNNGFAVVDPACDGALDSACEDDMIIYCECGYRDGAIDRLSCAPGHCVEQNGSATCD